MPTDDAILVAEPVPGVRVVTLNRPQAHNAIDLAMAGRLGTLLAAADADNGLRCLILTGTGDAAFSAGFDIREMAGFDAAAMRGAFVRRDPLFLRIAQLRIPVIAALNGLAYGAGALIAAACDVRIACAATRFKVTAIDYGSANATWSLPRLIGPARAKDILMTGRIVGAEEGLRIGLFDRLAATGDVLALALELGSEIATKPTEGVRAVKTLVDGCLDQPLDRAWQAEHDQLLREFEAGSRSGAEMFDRFLAEKRP
jgi:enoyl-CoA hydratase/carnithine racemase